MFEKMKEGLKGFLKKDRLVLILLAGVLLLVINIPVNKKQTVSGKETVTAAQSDFSTEDYVTCLEKKLEKILEATEGVGKTKVCITAVNNGRSVVHTQTDTSEKVEEETEKDGTVRRSKESTKGEDVVFTQESGRSTPFVEEEIVPEIKGVVVIAQGGGNASVVSDVTQAVSALLGISVNKIKVLKMEAGS